MHCPVCFASAGECLENGDLSIDEIEKQYDFLMDHGGPFNIQLSGGEPTMREDLPEIIHMGREKGFTFFQLNTNGIRLAQEAGYARKLKKAGLNTVFLQFDGVTDDVYQTLRGRSMMELKEKAVLNCSEAELGIALVPYTFFCFIWDFCGHSPRSYAICKRSTFPADQLFWQMFSAASTSSDYHTKDVEADRGTD